MASAAPCPGKGEPQLTPRGGPWKVLRVHDLGLWPRLWLDHRLPRHLAYTAARDAVTSTPKDVGVPGSRPDASLLPTDSHFQNVLQLTPPSADWDAPSNAEEAVGLSTRASRVPGAHADPRLRAP